MRLIKNNKIIFSIFVVAVTIFIGLTLHLNVLVENDAIDKRFIGDTRLLANPISQMHLEITVTDGGNQVITIPFAETTTLGGFSFFSPGNLHAASSFLPREFTVESLDVSGNWQVVDTISNNTSAVYQFNFPVNTEVQGLRLVVNGASYKNVAAFADLKFYTYEALSLFATVVRVFSTAQKGIPFYMGYSLVLVLYLFLSGLFFYKHLVYKTNTLSFEWGMLFSIVLSIAFLMLCGGLYALFYWDVFLYLPLIPLTVGTISLIYTNFSFDKIALLRLFAICFVVLLIADSIQAQRDILFNLPYIERYIDTLKVAPIEGGYFGYHADNTLPWGSALVLLTKTPFFSELADAYRVGFNGASFFDRTPGLIFTMLPVLKLFGDSHFIYQRFLTVLMSLFYVAVYVFVKEVKSYRAALVVTLLLLLNVPLSYRIGNVELYYKYFALLPLFMSLAVILKEKKLSQKHLITVAFLNIVAVVIHPLNLIFMCIVAIYFLLTSGLTRNFLHKILLTIVPTGLLFLGWLWLGDVVKGRYLNNSFTNIYVSKVSDLDSTMLYNKLANAVNIFIPDILLKGYEGSYFDVSFYDYYSTLFLRHSLIAWLSPLLFITLIISLLYNFRESWRWFLFGSGPLIFYWLTNHGYFVGGITLLFPFVLPFMFLCIVPIISSHKRLGPLLVLSYILWGIFSMYHLSGIFIGMHYVSNSIDILKWTIVSVYLILALILLRLIKRVVNNKL
jgi:hypothetical protein